MQNKHQSINKKQNSKSQRGLIKPYGDTFNDGMMQVSFTLPVPSGSRAVEAAKMLLMEIGFKDPVIVYHDDIGENFTYFIAYGKTDKSIDFDKIIPVEIKTKSMSREEVDRYIKKNFKRKIAIVGACTGDDAHTVGIDAILNMKGVDQHYGLERYEMFDVYNMGSQIKNQEVIDRALKVKADAILISQIVTQKETHINNLKDLIKLAEQAGIRKKTLLVVGGPRINHQLAVELGYNAGFGKGTYPEDVASFIAMNLKKDKV